MKRLIQQKRTTPVFLVVLLLCFGVLQGVQAVVPPPDGGYPGFNTAEGQKALFSLTTGQGNTAVGWFTLESLTTGNFNTAIGAGTLFANTADNNTATGGGALLNNTTGESNTANGTFALFSNTTGIGNTAAGMSALFSNTTGDDNIAIGNGALFINTDSYQNTAIGSGALFFNSTGGVRNTATGFQALNHNTAGNANTANGTEALLSNTTGDGNIAIGVGALRSNTSGTGNIGLGDDAGDNVTTANSVICIGTGIGENVSNSCYIGHIFNATSSGGTAVFINSNGKLGTMTSSRRFKEEIQPMEEASETLFALKPVTFTYKKEIDPAGTSQFGLVAEDVEKVNPQLVVRDKDGKPYSVRYDQVNAMLLNEFLKEHRKNEEQQAIIMQLKSTDAEQEAIIAQQQKQIEALTAGLQKVSAQLELSKPAPQTVFNSR